MYPDAEDRSHVAVQEETQTTVGGTSSPLHCSLAIEDSGMLSVTTENNFSSCGTCIYKRSLAGNFVSKRLGNTLL